MGLCGKWRGIRDVVDARNCECRGLSLRRAVSGAMSYIVTHVSAILLYLINFDIVDGGGGLQFEACATAAEDARPTSLISLQRSILLDIDRRLHASAGVRKL